ncbi:MAG: methanogenesis marker 3 protein [Candidatus Methanomethyliaceae archaeon]|nr:methanogenesis marker 3 protein [Candidatus Methanomethyliaceae archaeon]
MVDGTEMEAREDENLGDFLDRVGIIIKEGYIVAVKRKIDVESIPTNLYEVHTTRGKMIIRWECDDELEKWRRTYKSFEGCGVRWATIDAVVFGPTKTEFVPSKEEVELRRYEITVSLSGSSNESSHLVFSKRTHSALYFPPKGCRVLGRVVYGRHLLDVFRIGDKIVKISPVFEKKFDPRSLLRVEKDYKLKEGDMIFTKMEILLDTRSPVCVEHVYNMLSEGFTVTRKTSRFIAHDKARLISIKSEVVGERDRGVISVRSSGNNTGSVYIYLQKAAISKDHTIAGRVVNGIELADVAREGDLIRTVLTPERLDLLGRSQGEVNKVLERIGIKHVREGYIDDDGIVVDHSPATTIEIYKQGIVRCTGLPHDQILKVRLYENSAPISVKYFRRVAGLDLRRVGRLDVFFSTKDVVLFKGDESFGKSLMPENIPNEKVGAGEIGVTNSVKKFAGMVGIRLTESDKFGPTAESFDGTNIVGRVLENIALLKGLREGRRVYIMEGSQ